MNHVNMRLLFAHVPYTQGLPRQLMSSLVWNGQFGVQIFFAISGFLITSTSLRRWSSLHEINIRAFYRMRFARIAPLLILLLVILCILHQFGVPGFVISQKTGGLGRALLAALTFHINYLEASRGYLPGAWDILWSLSVEEIFYLFFPLICRFLGRTKFLIPLLVVFVLAGPFARSSVFNHNPVWREYSYIGGMDAIALGCLTALLSSRKTLTSTARWITGVIGAAAMIFILCFSLRAEAWGLTRNGLDMTILAIGGCMVILVSAQSGWQVPRVLGPLRRMGQHSYEIYLTHMFVVLTLFPLFIRLGKPLSFVPLLFLFVIVLASIVGELVARFYSEPMNRRLRSQGEVKTISPSLV